MLDPSAWLAIAPGLGLALYCAAHVVVSRLAPQRGCYFPLFIGCAVGMAGAAAVHLTALVLMHASRVDAAALSLMNLAAYLAFSFGYFNFINLNVASLRIRMLYELMESGGDMPVSAFARCYNTDDVIKLRIARLVGGRHLLEREGRFFSGRLRFLVVGRIFEFLRMLILGGHAPLEAQLPIPANDNVKGRKFVSNQGNPSGAACDITLFVACYNEQEAIIPTLETVLAAVTEVGCTYDIVVVDDASTDNSVPLVREFLAQHPDVPITHVVNELNLGLGVNYVEAAFRGTGKYYRTICGDNVETKDVLVTVFRRLGEAEMLLTYHSDASARTWSRRFISVCYTKLVNLLSGCKIRYYNGLPVLLRYDVMRWHPNSPGFGFQADLVTRLIYMGATYVEIPVKAGERTTGRSKALSFKNVCSVAHSLLEITIRRVGRLIDRGRYERLSRSRPARQG